jgi:hypothetical protein
MKLILENWRQYLMKENVIDAELDFLQKRTNEVGLILSLSKSPDGRYGAGFWYMPHRGIKVPMDPFVLEIWNADPELSQTEIFTTVLTLVAQSYEEIIWKIKHNLEHVLEPKYGNKARGVDVRINDTNNVVPLSRQED